MPTSCCWAFKKSTIDSSTKSQGSATEFDLYVCCRDEGSSNGGSAHPYGDYNCNIPPKTVEKFLDHVATLNPDIIVYTGNEGFNSFTLFFNLEVPIIQYLCNTVTSSIKLSPK